MQVYVRDFTTGAERLLDVHLVTDGAIAAKTSFAVKIGAVTDAARPLPLKGAAG